MSFTFFTYRTLSRGFALLLISVTLSQAVAGVGLTTETLTSKTVSSWKATDGVPVWEKTGGLSLPAGAQLSRTFDAKHVEVRMISKPFFSATPASWAALEVGPVSLSFVRDSKGGGMVLLADEPLELPTSVSLDQDGRSRVPLEFVLTYDLVAGEATLSIDKTLFEVEATVPVSAVEVAFSSGTLGSWSVDTLQLKFGESSATGNGSRTANIQPAGNAFAKTIPSGERLLTRRQAQTDAWNYFMQGSDLEGEKVLTEANLNPKYSAHWHLESANELVQIALSLARAGHPKKAAQVAQRALEHTEKAARKAARQSELAGIAAAADESAAFIHERLLGDYSEAQVLYQRAALRQPSGYGASAAKRIESLKAEAGRKAVGAK